MYFYIDNSNHQETIFCLLDEQGNIIQKNISSSLFQQSDDLLLRIQDFLLGKEKEIQGIIILHVGERFTAIRTAVVIGNALSFSLKIPLVAVDTNNFIPKDLIFSFDPILPVYKD